MKAMVEFQELSNEILSGSNWYPFHEKLQQKSISLSATSYAPSHISNLKSISRCVMQVAKLALYTVWYQPGEVVLMVPWSGFNNLRGSVLFPQLHTENVIQTTMLNPDMCNPDFHLNRTDWKVTIPSHTYNSYTHNPDFA